LIFFNRTFAGTFVIHDCSTLFNKGLPDQYAFVATFRLTAKSTKKTWSIVKVADVDGKDQLNIRINPKRVSCSQLSYFINFLLFGLFYIMRSQPICFVQCHLS